MRQRQIKVKYDTFILEYRRKREEETKEVSEAIMVKNFPKLMRFQTTDLGSSKNTNQETIPRHVIFKL